jgi:hypothetical protein
MFYFHFSEPVHNLLGDRVWGIKMDNAEARPRR